MSLQIHTERRGPYWRASCDGVVAYAQREARAVRLVAEHLRQDYEPRDSIADAITAWQRAREARKAGEARA